MSLGLRLVWSFSIFTFSKNRKYTCKILKETFSIKIFPKSCENLKTMISHFQCFLCYLWEAFLVENVVAKWQILGDILSFTSLVSIWQCQNRNFLSLLHEFIAMLNLIKKHPSCMLPNSNLGSRTCIQALYHNATWLLVISICLKIDKLNIFLLFYLFKNRIYFYKSNKFSKI